MKGGESLDPILISQRTGKPSTRFVFRYRARYLIDLRWLAFRGLFSKSRARVYYDEGNSRLSSISAFIRGPLLFVTTLRNPHPSDSPSSASYSVSASSLRRLIHVYITVLISGAALPSVVSGALRWSVSSSRWCQV